MLQFALSEVVAARDAARRFGGLVDQLREGDTQRFIIFSRNRPQAVLMHIDEYERLLQDAGYTQRAAA